MFSFLNKLFKKKEVHEQLDINEGLNALKINIKLYDEIHKSRAKKEEKKRIVNKYDCSKFKNEGFITFLHLIYSVVEEFDLAYFVLVANMDAMEIENEVVAACLSRFLNTVNSNKGVNSKNTAALLLAKLGYMAICYQLANSEKVMKKYIKKDEDGELLLGETKYKAVGRFVRELADRSGKHKEEVELIAYELEQANDIKGQKLEETVMLKEIMKELK